ncbi:Unknown protein [Striga hermonthica]|uniref:Uncharacterized protein n=1 Tax=Striga hermonthica TaxID=68872 RepID=A0A9N7NDI2_STRHE|nr:Unknown protein [Striga hermonthica]
MAEPSSPGRSSTAITDLDMDALTRCAGYLCLQDVSSLAMSCKYLNRAAYSDSVWRSLYSQEWPHVPIDLKASSVREAYLSRHISLRQFKYVDPLVRDVYTAGESLDHMLLDRNSIIFSQGQYIKSLNTENLVNGRISVATRGNHNSRITCMRLFSPSEACLYQSGSEGDDNALITSSTDRFIRLWFKGGNRCFKGHTGPVLTLSDKLLGDNSGKIFASGGEDCTVRLWSINSSGKRGQQALKVTLLGHEKAVSLMSVAGHKTSLLVSISKNGKVKVWDTTTASSSTRSSCCVGSTSLPGVPVGMKCHESLVYVATGSSMLAVDLRTMSRAFMAVHEGNIHSFEFLPSKSLICTGGAGRAMLWDIRRFSEPTVELSKHEGPVKLLHLDRHKIVTGGPYDSYIKVWETDTGEHLNSLISSGEDGKQNYTGCSTMAVDRCRIVTGGGVAYGANSLLRFRDFRAAAWRVPSGPYEPDPSVSKFWGSLSDIDSDSEESVGFL